MVDLVIQAVDKLIDASSDQSSGSAAQLKDTFALRRVQTFPQPESAIPHLAWPIGGALAQATLLIL